MSMDIGNIFEVVRKHSNARTYAGHLPHIRIAKPREDVCGTCERLRKYIVGAVTQEKKLLALREMENHITDARNVV
ncbi:hypothetical protein DPMN_155236 [Dreissena polymorpha]|uniref:Uncharacterized protein n=1 Tax=Dreissena polymorpha TaxID=45954 RepID=A0A9D4FRF1_DREPO|nr:hypothetical protein DPMN_155236 [Dreissena polymorpha]